MQHLDMNQPHDSVHSICSRNGTVLMYLDLERFGNINLEKCEFQPEVKNCEFLKHLGVQQSEDPKHCMVFPFQADHGIVDH